MVRAKSGDGHPRTDEEAKGEAKRRARAGAAKSTQAGSFVHEEMHHAKEGKHGVTSRKQAVAIGLSKARRAGVKVGRKSSSGSGGNGGSGSRNRRASTGKGKSTARSGGPGVRRRGPKQAAAAAGSSKPRRK